MEFNPRHEKWQCCCFRISTGLTVLATIEAIVASTFLAISAFSMRQNLLNAERAISSFHVFLLIMFALLFSTSLLVIFGIRQLRSRLLFPSLLIRILFIFFIAAFGIATCVEHNDEQNTFATPIYLERKKFKATTTTTTISPFINIQEAPSKTARLVFVMILMITLISIIFYTIYLVVICIRFLHCLHRRQERRNSLVIAGQIDPRQFQSKHRGSTTIIVARPI